VRGREKEGAFPNIQRKETRKVQKLKRAWASLRFEREPEGRKVPLAL
jgi:hypothetical protein